MLGNSSLLGIEFSALNTRPFGKLGPILPLYLSFCIITRGRKISRLLPPPTYVYTGTAEAIPPHSPFPPGPRPGVNLHSLRATALALPNKEEEEEKTYPKRGGGSGRLIWGSGLGRGSPPPRILVMIQAVEKEFGN